MWSPIMCKECEAQNISSFLSLLFQNPSFPFLLNRKWLWSPILHQKEKLRFTNLSCPLKSLSTSYKTQTKTGIVLTLRAAKVHNFFVTTVFTGYTHAPQARCSCLPGCTSSQVQTILNPYQKGIQPFFSISHCFCSSHHLDSRVLPRFGVL